MPRIIEIQEPDALAAPLTVTVGDVLWIAATGGRTHGPQLEMLGAFTQGVAAVTGDVVIPAGPPNTVLFAARREGLATIDVVVGDPWSSPRAVGVSVIVEK